jgi:hypothetical protein
MYQAKHQYQLLTNYYILATINHPLTQQLPSTYTNEQITNYLLTNFNSHLQVLNHFSLLIRSSYKKGTIYYRNKLVISWRYKSNKPAYRYYMAK